MKDRKKEKAIYFWKELIQLVVNMLKYYLKVDCNMYIVNPKAQAGQL